MQLTKLSHVPADAPHTRAALIRALEEVEAEVAAFFGSLSPEEFVVPEGEAWSPAGHLAHLNITVSATARGFSISRWLLRIRFGRAGRPSRSFDQLTSDYRARLASGAGAPSRFVPSPEVVEGEPEEVRSALLARWHRVNGRLRSAVSGWPEEALDRIQLPHPLLGKITARELVLFVIYHGSHHVTAAKRRLPRFDS